ncbi:uncharacterized protein LOC121835721 [Ixodes scapularis]|uniref:uncharacterized protein LOC121835721 n=1 Tax=Ixodes scapularis TaxID=6945 RepID=UPI001C38953E|nr:uncharacterized protein LOC121835721 [Ixodes scapularis]
MLPLTFVEQPEFVAFVKGTCPATINVMSRRTLGRRVDSDYDAHLERVRAALKMPLYVCLTADVWSTSTKSYLGVTAHWISEATLERQSAALACRRFAGTHSYDRVAELLSDVCTDYCLPTGKITGTVTDNATNFVKAFKEFGVTAFEEACAADSEDFELVTFEEIEPPGPLLSQHLRCACHTLSLIATADVKKATSANHALNRLHSSVMSKCSKYWGASGRPKSAEVVTSILGKQLPAPCITRWNSLHHALDVLTQNKEKLQDLSNELQLPSLKSSEIEFIEEYCTILKPIATALDRLQGSSNSGYYAELLPVLFTVRAKLEQVRENLQSPHTEKIAQAALDSLERRFQRWLCLGCAGSVYRVYWELCATTR